MLAALRNVGYFRLIRLTAQNNGQDMKANGPLITRIKVINLTKSQHIWQQQNVAPQLINIWSTATYTVFDRVTVDRQQQLNTALQQLAWIPLDTDEVVTKSFYRLPARLYASQGGSCCVRPVAVGLLHLTVDGCTSHVYCYSNDWSGCPEVLWRHM